VIAVIGARRPRRCHENRAQLPAFIQQPVELLNALAKMTTRVANRFKRPASSFAFDDTHTAEQKSGQRETPTKRAIAP
jgi:hypothetical protein